MRPVVSNPTVVYTNGCRLPETMSLHHGPAALDRSVSEFVASHPAAHTARVTAQVCRRSCHNGGPTRNAWLSMPNALPSCTRRVLRWSKPNIGFCSCGRAYADLAFKVKCLLPADFQRAVQRVSQSSSGAAIPRLIENRRVT
jgi:hypothetical protein